MLEKSYRKTTLQGINISQENHLQNAIFGGYASPEKSTFGKGDSFSKPSCSTSMSNFGGVQKILILLHLVGQRI